MFLILFALCVVLLSVIFRGTIRRYYLTSKFVGPPTYPVIGNAYLFFKKTPAENFDVMKQVIDKYGPCVRMWMGPDQTFFMTDPKDIEFILSSQQLIKKGGIYEMLKPWLNDGLLISTGKKWHQRRKILTPAFHFKILDQFVDIFDQQSRTLVDVLRKYKKGEKVELYPHVTLYALDVICETAMGTTINAQLHTDSPYIRAVKDMAQVIHRRIFDITVRRNFLFNYSDLFKVQEHALKIMHSFTNDVIQQRREELIDSGKNPRTTDEQLQEFGIKKKKAFLDILLEAKIDGLPLSDADIREEVDTFMFEGHDTTTAGITFSLYCIAKYPEVQKKCFEEIVNVIGTDKDRAVTVSDLNNLQYLEKVIKETMRMFPPVPIYGRVTTEETEINGKVFPPDVTLLMPIYFMGHNPAYFDDPETFRPERFDIEEKDDKSTPTFAYVPFSAGPRNCIGQKFAMLEMKSAVTKILRHFELSLDDESKKYPILIPELILRTMNNFKFYINPRVY